MADTLKRKIADKEYTFYRTSLMDNITYYVLFDSEGKRDSVKISKNTQGVWTLDSSNAPHYIQDAVAEMIEAIRLKEDNSPSQ